MIINYKSILVNIGCLLFIYLFTCASLLFDVDVVLGLGTMGDSCNILIPDQRWKGERRFSLSNISVSAIEDAPQPDLDFAFSA